MISSWGVKESAYLLFGSQKGGYRNKNNKRDGINAMQRQHEISSGQNQYNANIGSAAEQGIRGTRIHVTCCSSILEVKYDAEIWGNSLYKNDIYIYSEGEEDSEAITIRLTDKEGRYKATFKVKRTTKKKNIIDAYVSMKGVKG